MEPERELRFPIPQASVRAVRRSALLDGRRAARSRLSNELEPSTGAPVLESRDILTPTTSVLPPDFVRTPGALVFAVSNPRPANSAAPSTPKPRHRTSASVTLAPLPGSTRQMASSIDPGIHSKCAAPSWLLDAVSIAKPLDALDVGPSAPAVPRVPPSPSSGSLYLE